MIKINLLPVRLAKKKETARRQISIASLLTVFLMILMGGFYLSKASEIRKLKADIDSSNQELERLKKEIGELSRLKEEKKVIEEKLNIVRQLEKNKTGPVRLLDDIVKAIPEKVWLESLKDSDTTTIMTGFAISEEMIAEFMRGLERSPNLSRVVLEISQKTDKGGIKLKGFTIRLEKARPGQTTDQRPKT